MSGQIATADALGVQARCLPRADWGRPVRIFGATPLRYHSRVAQLIIFDGDDTLWSTETLYDNARALARHKVEEWGLDGEAWEVSERVRDVANVDVWGLSAARFPTSCVEALDDVTDVVDPVLADAVRAAAETVFTAAAPVVEGAAEVLTVLSERCRLALLTKGDHHVQTQRIESSGLAHLFDHVEIVGSKTADTFSHIATMLGVDPASTISVGNSLSSDIAPAIESGMYGVLIDAHVWEYERHRSDKLVVAERVIVADSLLELPAVVNEVFACH